MLSSSNTTTTTTNTTNKRQHMMIDEPSQSSSSSSSSLQLNGNKIIYLDYLSTTPLCKESSQAMQQLLSSSTSDENNTDSGWWGNPSLTYGPGLKAKELLQQARQSIAELIHAPSEDCIIFESCATETINHAILGTLSKSHHHQNRKHIVSSTIEHPAVLECISHATSTIPNCTCTFINPQVGGIVSAQDVANAVIPGQTAIVSIMLANNELGSINPIQEIIKLVRAKDLQVIIHVDASQAVGKIFVNVQNDIQCDLLTIAAHKLFGPKGIAALYIAPGITMNKLFFGGGQEFGKRSGTENVLLAVGFGAAAKAAQVNCLMKQNEIRSLTQYLLEKLQNELKKYDIQAILNGPSLDKQQCTLPGALSISFVRINTGNIVENDKTTAIVYGYDIVHHASKHFVYFSSGPACHHHTDGSPTPSKILIAAGIPSHRALSTIRLYVGRYTLSKQDIDEGVHVIVKSVLESCCCCTST
jgi:cysteine desulfurase